MNFATELAPPGDSKTAPPVLGVVPARIGSSRLPRKPLQEIRGRPLVEWVWRRVTSFPLLDRVVVATDADEVADACGRFGAEVLLTDGGHATGTDRVAEVVCREGFRSYPIVVNVQGDEPLVSEDEVRQALAQVTREGRDLGTCAAPLSSVEAWRDPTVVKVARARDGRALYFSRAPIPWKRDATPTAEDLEGGPYHRHLGLYAYRREALLQWVALPPTPLEELEKLEQLRALEAGLTMGVGLVEGTAGGVDTQEDLERMEALLARDAG